jgi:hypothetical protein
MDTPSQPAPQSSGQLSVGNNGQLVAPIASPKPGVYTTQFWLAILTIGALVALTAYGKIPGEFGAVALAVVAAAYHWLRKETYAELTINPNDHLAGLVGEIMEHLPDATPAEVADILRAFSGATHPSLLPIHTAPLAGPEANATAAGVAQTTQGTVPPGSGAGVTPGLLGLILVGALLFAGCAARTTFWYASGKKKAEFQGNYATSKYSDGSTHWDSTQVDHATATREMGHAVGHIVKKTGDAVTEVGLAVLPAATGGGSLPVQAATKAAAFGGILSNSSGSPVPAATPKPTPAPKP